MAIGLRGRRLNPNRMMLSAVGINPMPTSPKSPSAELSKSRSPGNISSGISGLQISLSN